MLPQTQDHDRLQPDLGPIMERHETTWNVLRTGSGHQLYAALQTIAAKEVSWRAPAMAWLCAQVVSVSYS